VVGTALGAVLLAAVDDKALRACRADAALTCRANWFGGDTEVVEDFECDVDVGDAL